jgi:hypothetical protein
MDLSGSRENTIFKKIEPPHFWRTITGGKTMASDAQSDKKIRYQSYEQYREQFFGSEEKPTTEVNQDENDTASFGKRLAREFTRRE